MKIGIGQFSYHRYFGELTPWEHSPKCRWRVEDFMRHALSHGVRTVGVQTSYVAPAEAERLREIASAHGLEVIPEWGHPVGLDMGRSPEAVRDLRVWIKRAHKWSLPLLRIVAGHARLRGQEPVETQIKRLAPILRRISLEAMDCGITLALENHGDFTPLELLTLIQEARSANLRALLDFGNTVRVGANLVSSVRSLGPLITLVHLRDIEIQPESIGDPMAFWPTVPLGRGSLDVPGALLELYGSGFDGCLLLELSNLHPSWNDQEDEVIHQSLLWLGKWQQTGIFDC